MSKQTKIHTMKKWSKYPTKAQQGYYVHTKLPGDQVRLEKENVIEMDSKFISLGRALEKKQEYNQLIRKA